MEDLAGKQFGSYRVVAPLGEGGMAAVYKAYQPSVDRHVALKILSRYYTTDPEFLTRFTHEAKIVAQLQHPHILSVFDFGESDGYTYLVMPFVNGGTLASLLKGTPVSMNATLKIAGQICAALDYAHSKGIVHRDIKPSNILIDEGGNCLVADFGLARMAEGSQKLTMTGTVMGTPAYMSPEQAAGKEIGPQSDIYSAGIVLYEMLTGRVPFQAETPIAVAIKHLTDPLPPPRSLNPALSEQTEAVLLKALARVKEDRFASGEALMIALTSALQSAQQADTLVAPPPAAPAPGPSAFPAAASTLAMRGAPVTAPAQEITGATFRHVEPAAGGGKGSSWMAIAAAAVVVIGVVAYFVVGRSADQPAAAPQTAAAVAAPTAPKAADRPANPEPVAPTPSIAAAAPAAPPVTSTATAAKDDTFEKGRVAFNARRYAEAMPLLQSAADGGNVGAMFMLGLSYDQGRGVPADLAEARQWYEKAATAGNGEAMNRLGSLYMTGRGGLPRNLNLARQWFEKSAAAGTPAGMMQLGDLYANGRGVPKDIAQARQWYEKADALHFQGAQQRLANLGK